MSRTHQHTNNKARNRSTKKKEIERYFIWVDEEGKRAGPRHYSLKAALNYRRMWGQGVEDHKEHYPSNKEPVKLIVAELVEREMTEDEHKAYEMWNELHKMGLS